MEYQKARRRMNAIAAHFSPADDVSAPYVFPMNCGGSLSSVFRRCDNRLYFARQGSAYQAPFMRQASMTEGGFAQSGMPLKCSSSTAEVASDGSEGPQFSRPALMQPAFPNAAVSQPVAQGCSLASPEPPKYARPSQRTNGEKHLVSMKETSSSRSSGTGLSSKMTVLESTQNYVVAVEMPGVHIADIRVEVDDQKLTVLGRRSDQYFRVTSCSNDPFSAYQRREILQRPYKVAWPLPAYVNKDKISAEFWDGLLQIIVPKI